MRGWLAAYKAEPFWAVPLGVLLSLAVCGLYHVYRYPLRINSTSTSPTYSDTPTSLQIGKYALLGIIACAVGSFALAKCPRTAWSLTRRDWILVALALLASGRAVIAAWRSGTLTSLDIVGPIVSVVPIALLAALWFSLRPRAVNGFARQWFAFGIVLLVLNTVVNVAEIVAWKTTGRLPALGYEDDLVRFGGIWDDPNSSGAYAAAFGIVLLSRRVELRRGTSLALAWCVLFDLAVAWSYSSWVLAAVGVSILFVCRVWRHALAVAAVVSALVVGLLLVPNPTAPTSGRNVVAKAVSGQKEESARQRLGANSYLDTPKSPVEWLVGRDEPRQVENAFGNWLTATGLVGTALLAAWILLTVRAVWSTVERRWVAAVLTGAVTASLFVPHVTVFPVASFLVLALALAASYWERTMAGSRVQSLTGGS